MTNPSTDHPSLRVLLIDDEELLRRTLRRLLEVHGFRVQDFESGACALSAITEFKPHVVVTDVRMPDMDGVEVLVRIKDSFPQVAVILVTGHIDPDFNQELTNRGAFSVLVKPVPFVQLVEAIRAAGSATV